MLGRNRNSKLLAAACVALAFTATSCSRDSATTGPSGKTSKDFAAGLRLVSGDQQVGPIGGALTAPIVVRVVDAGGQAVQGATVTFSVRAGGGSVNPAANVSGADGTVAVTWTMGATLGANKVVALLTNSFLLDSTTFTATATSGAATKFTMVSGDAQTANVSKALAAPLVVRVQDQFNNNLSGVKVTWTAAAGSGSIAFLSDTTAADGSASATWTLGTVAGTQTVTASLNGVITTIPFTAIATADTTGTVTMTQVALFAGGKKGIASTGKDTIKVKVVDRFNNPVTSTSITWNDSTFGGLTLSALTAQTDATGIASTVVTYGSRLGTQLVRARLTSGVATATFVDTATVYFADVFAGNFMACGIVASNNNVYCWGNGTDGQLGNGGTVNSNAPTTAVGDVPIQSRQLMGGRDGFCSLTIGRTLSCWGKTPMAAQSPAPSSVTLTISGATAFPNFVGLGEDFGCIATLAGDVGCSGVNLHGQLGNASIPTGQPAGTFVSLVSATVSVWSGVVVGRTHGCAIPRFTGAVASQVPQCWGMNNVGQAGTGNGAGTFTDVAFAKPITMPTGTMRFDSLMTAGANHTCAIEAGNSDTPGRAWCWGGNGYGQLGAAGVPIDTGRRDTPVPVQFPAGVTGWKRIYAGEFHTCALEANTSTTPGKAWCWGRNDYGQLGFSASAPVSVPTTAVSGAVTYRSLSIGEFFTCGVNGAALVPGAPSQPIGTVYCWGDNLFGELGNGQSGNIPVATPTKISNQP